MYWVIVQVLVLPTVESSISKILRHKIKGLDTYASNIYGVPECILLTWLNHHYEEQYTILFPNSGKMSYHNDAMIDQCVTEVNEQRYIKSFDVDLMDSVVLACVMIAYIPYLVSISCYHHTVTLPHMLYNRHQSIFKNSIHFPPQLNNAPIMLLFWSKQWDTLD